MKTTGTTDPSGKGPDFFSADVAHAKRFYLDLNPARSRELAVVCGGMENCTADYAIHRATFPFYSIEYVAAGTGALELNGQNYVLSPGMIFSYGPGVPHRIKAEGGGALVKYFVDFTGRHALRLLGACRLLPGRAARVFPPDALARLFDELIQSGMLLGRKDDGLCVMLLECMAAKISRTDAPVKGTETLAFSTYQQCRNHIEQRFAGLKTLQQIADECHVDRAYLCRLFRRYDHQSPYQYLLRLKVNAAAGRLHESGVLIKQLAAKMGFADPFHFSRVFRNILGASPAAFRKLR